MKFDWEPCARRLAERTTPQVSRWREPVAATPRHLFVPRWFRRTPDAWEIQDGPSDPTRWAAAAYDDRSLVTSVGGQHADDATSCPPPTALPTSSATLPSLVVRMFRYAQLFDGARLLEIGTGSGYSTALVARRLGDRHVTSIDIDPHLTRTAAERLDRLGLHPELVTGDATGALAGRYDRLVAMVAPHGIPGSWLAALEPGGRLVTVLARTTLIITAEKTGTGAAIGRVEWERAGFMHARTGPDHPPRLHATVPIDHAAGVDSRGRHPITNVADAWDLQSMLELTAPGIEHAYSESEHGVRTASMRHADGSWALAVALGDHPPDVCQGGPRRLWDILDDLRDRWCGVCEFPLRGADVLIDADGTLHLRRGRWSTTLRPNHGKEAR